MQNLLRYILYLHSFKNIFLYILIDSDAALEQMINPLSDAEGETVLPMEIEQKFSPKDALLWQITQNSNQTFDIYNAMQEFAKNKGFLFKLLVLFCDCSNIFYQNE